MQEESGVNSDFPSEQLAPKVIRQFPQTKPVADQTAGKIKPSLSKDVLAGVSSISTPSPAGERGKKRLANVLTEAALHFLQVFGGQ